ncbi:hypothetical protein JCM17960_14460 [Magnetospira thiophila]
MPVKKVSPNPGYVASSRFVVIEGLEDTVKAAFRNRPRLVDSAPGFLRMDVISPDDHPQEIWLLTYWTDKSSYDKWHKSHHFKDSHKDMPPGLKVLPSETEVRFFQYISD